MQIAALGSISQQFSIGLSKTTTAILGVSALGLAVLTYCSVCRRSQRPATPLNDRNVTHGRGEAGSTTDHTTPLTTDRIASAFDEALARLAAEELLHPVSTTSTSHADSDHQTSGGPEEAESQSPHPQVTPPPLNWPPEDKLSRKSPFPPPTEQDFARLHCNAETATQGLKRLMSAVHRKLCQDKLLKEADDPERFEGHLQKSITECKMWVALLPQICNSTAIEPHCARLDKALGQLEKELTNVIKSFDREFVQEQMQERIKPGLHKIYAFLRYAFPYIASVAQPAETPTSQGWIEWGKQGAIQTAFYGFKGLGVIDTWLNQAKGGLKLALMEKVSGVSENDPLKQLVDASVAVADSGLDLAFALASENQTNPLIAYVLAGVPLTINWGKISFEALRSLVSLEHLKEAMEKSLPRPKGQEYRFTQVLRETGECFTRMLEEGSLTTYEIHHRPSIAISRSLRETLTDELGIPTVQPATTDREQQA